MAMRFACRVGRSGSGEWIIRYDAPDLGPLQVTAATRDEGLEKMRGELRYRLEFCPCSGEAYRDISIELHEADELEQSDAAD